MSSHWRPEDDVVEARLSAGRSRLERLRRHWRGLPHGSRTALVLLAIACVAAGIALYEVAGPRDVFERSAGVDWSVVDAAGRR